MEVGAVATFAVLKLPFSVADKSYVRRSSPLGAAVMAYRAYRKYIPRADAAALMWAQPFAATLSAHAAAYGVSAETAAAILAAVDDFAAALARATAPDTRTASAVAMKNQARAAMEKRIRPAVRGIQALPATAGIASGTVVSDAAREALGLPIYARKATTAPLPPDTAPDLHVTAIHRRAHTLRLADAATPTRKARPPGTAGAEIYYRLADGDVQASAPSHRPDDLKDWRFAGLATRDTFRLETPGAAPGQVLTITARWLTRQGKPGPRANPITATVAA
jgi:hypothetical protein